MTTVVIGAQYASGSPNNRATSSEATAATAVRTECTMTGNAARLTLFHPRNLFVGKSPPVFQPFSLGDLLAKLAGRFLLRLEVAPAFGDFSRNLFPEATGVEDA